MSSVVVGLVHRVRLTGSRLIGMFDALERRERWLVGIGLGCLLTMITFMSIFHTEVLHWMAASSAKFRKVPWNWLILFLLYVFVSFPPMIGYSALALFTGMVYGFPLGWPLIASGTVIGSFSSFLVFRYLLKERAAQLAQKSMKFTAFIEILRQDSFLLLWMIRLCPLPYSLSNAAMSTIPSVQPWKFFLATLCCTPKLFLHIFIGSRLVKLSDAKDNASWWANFISVFLAVTVGIITSYIIYQRTKEKAAALQAGGYTAAMPEADDFEISDNEEEEEVEEGLENPFTVQP